VAATGAATRGDWLARPNAHTDNGAEPDANGHGRVSKADKGVDETGAVNATGAV
jgi:hypothetical protein